MATSNRHRKKGSGRMRRGMAGTVVAAVAVAGLTASGAPGGPVATPRRDGAPDSATGESGGWLPPAGPSADAYHTELPPLRGSKGVPVSGGEHETPEVRTQSGIPATVLTAYRNAEDALADTDPGCHLPWQLLAAIGKVESGQARGGRVDADGTTLTPILGPVLNGSGFARISDTDGGRYDGDTTYDRAVGPMQFIPSTWARWGADGNDDGRADPNNIHDAALAAARYLCAGSRNLTRKADLDRAILSYNHSSVYLRKVLSWLDFYRRGTHEIPDGRGPLPTSPGPGGKTPATQPAGGGGLVIGPQPTHPRNPHPGDSASPDPTRPAPRPTAPGPRPRPIPPTPTNPNPTTPNCPSPTPSEDPTPTREPSPSATPTPSDPTSPSPSPTPTESPSPTGSRPPDACSP
ncbi:lytic transglycosylase domain-containing protein [Streptomyces sp. NPDC050439]|uniref:lytic transglycosylase domain-containing protein n=1 Tax=unclassified Streptomyces TaxID=2593676 RepID=UPI003416AE21